MKHKKSYGDVVSFSIDKDTIQKIMLDVIVAMLPALVMSIYFFGIRSIFLVLITVISCVISEFLIQKALGKKIRIVDLSAVVTGMLLAFTLPVNFPFWKAALGGIFSIVIVKELFGGIGQNFMNPALAGRVFLMISWPKEIFSFTYDGVSTATFLSGQSANLFDLFIGNIPGTIGEVSKLALLIGGVYLLFKRVINLRIPIIYLGTLFILFYLLKYDTYDTLSQILSGGIILGAIFMLTDYSTSPITKYGQVIYALGTAILTFIIRLYGLYPEGVSFSIIIMNVMVPTIDRYIKSDKF